MSFPSDVELPSNAKYYGFIDHESAFIPTSNISWTFSFKLSGHQHGICTFVTTVSSLEGANPGHYLGYLTSYDFIKDEDNNPVNNEDDERLYVDPLTGFDKSGKFAIAFDSTGLFAAETLYNYGVDLSNTKANSLIIRNYDDGVIFNQELSALHSSFVLNDDTFKTIRVRVNNTCRKLYVDYLYNSVFYNLATVSLSNSTISSTDTIYHGFVFCSPISSSDVSPSTLYLKDYKVNSGTEVPITETVAMSSIYIEALSTTNISI